MTPSQSMRRVPPSGVTRSTPVTFAPPWMAAMSVPSSSGMRKSLGSRRAGQRAVTRPAGSTMATGRMPMWRQVSSAEKETSSVPSTRGREKGFRRFR